MRRTNKLIRALVFCAALSLLFTGCIRLDTLGRETSGTNAEYTVRPPEKDPLDPSTYVYYSRTARELEEYLSTEGCGDRYLLLVNKVLENHLDIGYIPADLVAVPEEYLPSWSGEIKLESRVQKALVAMLAEMVEDGVNDIMVTSGYRSFAYQSDVFNRYLRDEQASFTDNAYRYFSRDYLESKYGTSAKGLDYPDALEVVQSYSAKAGESEHQSGLCIDFITATMDGNLNEEFEKTPAFRWLSDNAYRFGFILRYPKDKVDVTGYSYEPWHYRYVGREAAAAIKVGGLTLEEYLSSAR